MSKLKKENIGTRKISLIILTVLMVGIIAVCFLACSQGNDDKTSGEKVLFSSLYYYEGDKEQRYEAYAKANPDLDAGDVVWQVNAGLDGEYYVDYTEYENEDDMNDYLVIVNKYHKLPESYEPDDLMSTSGRAELRNAAANAYSQMEKAAKEEDIKYLARTGYRSYGFQNYLYESYKDEDPDGADKYSARPGFSEHQTGLTVDIGITDTGSLREFNDTKEAKWVAENAYKYGFIIRYTEENAAVTGYMSESWHLRYIGEKHSGLMHQNGITSLEEYKVKYIDHSPE